MGSWSHLTALDRIIGPTTHRPWACADTLRYLIAMVCVGSIEDT